MNKAIFDQYEKLDSISNYFYKSIKRKPPSKKASDKEIFSYEFKYCLAALFFALGNTYHEGITKITKYYPFSLLFRDRLYHYDNIKVRSLMIKLEEIAKNADIDILILRGNQENQMNVFYGLIDKRTENRDKICQLLEKTLQKEYGTVYVRDNGKEVNILIPTEMLDIL